MNNKIIIIGGDERQRKLCNMLNEKGYNCLLLNESGDNVSAVIYDYQLIVFPIPFSSDGIYIYTDNPEFKVSAEKTASCINSNQFVFAGMLNNEIKNIFLKNNVKFSDVGSVEYFTKYNAFLTAQGALKLLLLNTDSYIVGKSVLITGFGRIGKALASMLHSLGMRVSVAARRKEQLIEAECLDYDVMQITEAVKSVYVFDYIFNTVPEHIFFETDIYKMRPDSIYFELASRPFGADEFFFKKHNKKYVPGGGLPGKHVSFSAAEIIAHVIEDFVQKGDIYE